MSGYVRAKINFYHDSVGTRQVGQVFAIQDAETCKTLENMGYVEKLQAQAHSEEIKAHEEQQAKQQEYGQAQARANEGAALQAHQQNVQANKLTQDFNQELQQKSQSSQAQSQAVQQQAQANINQDKAREFAASATTNEATLKETAKLKAEANAHSTSKGGNRVMNTHEDK